jgi:signal transduction protein with GAF and PtsI domain
MTDEAKHSKDCQSQGVSKAERRETDDRGTGQGVSWLPKTNPVKGVNTMRTQSAVVKPFDASKLEEEVRDSVHQSRPYLQANDHVPRAAPAPPVPEYVTHRDDVSEIGKLSAEAIIKEYEETAKEIEAMGDVVRDMVKRCDELSASASSMLKDIKLTAARYRKEGKRMFTEIESCSSAADEVRKLCEDFRDKLAAKQAEALK